MVVVVIAGLGKIELRLAVPLVAGEFLADVVAEVVFEVGDAVDSVGRDLLAEGHEVAAGDDLPEAIDQNPRRA